MGDNIQNTLNCWTWKLQKEILTRKEIKSGRLIFEAQKNNFHAYIIKFAAKEEAVKQKKLNHVDIVSKWQACQFSLGVSFVQCQGSSKAVMHKFFFP